MVVHACNLSRRTQQLEASLGYIPRLSQGEGGKERREKGVRTVEITVSFAAQEQCMVVM